MDTSPVPDALLLSNVPFLTEESLIPCSTSHGIAWKHHLDLPQRCLTQNSSVSISHCIEATSITYALTTLKAPASLRINTAFLITNICPYLPFRFVSALRRVSCHASLYPGTQKPRFTAQVQVQAPWRRASANSLTPTIKQTSQVPVIASPSAARSNYT